MFNRLKSSIPNTITCLNLLSGCLACIFASRSSAVYGTLSGSEVAMVCIAAAAVFDFMDGASARALRAYSALGKELDSLADLVSFGLAPALLLFNAIEAYTAHDHWLAWIALMIPVMGALRLARFNIDDRQGTTFIGLPIPANAIFWIGAVAFLHQHFGDTAACSGGLTMTAQLILGCIIVVESLLMVSPLRMFSLKAHNLSLRDNYMRIGIVIAAIFLVIFLGVPGLGWTMALYVLLCLLRPAV